MWSALFLTLPTRPNAVRLRVRRALEDPGLRILALFDRAEAHGTWRTEVQSLIVALPGPQETEARHRRRGMAEALQVLRSTDHHPGAPAALVFDALYAAPGRPE